MKGLKLICLCIYGLLLSSGIKAQGVHFYQSYEEARELATKQNKLLFVDFYTQWCGPCKKMVKFVFPQEEVGKFFNKHFICIKLDAENEGKELAKKYKIHSYPTLLFLNTNGEAVHKTGFNTAETLIAEAKKALELRNSSDNLVNIIKDYESRKHDVNFLKDYIERLEEANMPLDRAIEDYLEIQTEMKEDSKEMLFFLKRYMNHLKLGGNAWRIIDNNLDAYLRLPMSNMQKQQIKFLRNKLINNTRKAALANKDAELYRLCLEYWEKREKSKNEVPMQEMHMELMLLDGKVVEYKKEMVSYIDSIMYSQKVKDLHNSNANWKVSSQVRKIIRLADPFLKVAGVAGADEEKAFMRWVDYGKALMPDNYAILNLEANILYWFGHSDEAVKIKSKALENVPPTKKARYWITNEMKEMKEGTFKGGKREILP